MVGKVGELRVRFLGGEGRRVLDRRFQTSKVITLGSQDLKPPQRRLNEKIFAIISAATTTIYIRNEYTCHKLAGGY